MAATENLTFSAAARAASAGGSMSTVAASVTRYNRRVIERLRQIELQSHVGAVGEPGDFAEVHGSLGDNADLNPIAERVVTIGGIGVGLVPGDEIRVWTPVGFLPVE